MFRLERRNFRWFVGIGSMETEVAEGLTHRPEDVVAFVNRLVNEHIEYDGPERRATRREPISVPVEVRARR